MFFSRGKNKVQDLHNLKDSYVHYIDNLDDNKTYEVGYELYRSIISRYYKLLMFEILHGYEFRLPFGFGYMNIIKRKVNIHSLTRFGIDWTESVKNKKVIYYLNSHSKSYIYRFKWAKETSKIPNLYFYKFVASRENKRELARIIKNRECDFFEG